MGRLRWVFAALFLSATSAVAECRQALVLAIDVSASVDFEEYRLQSQGLAFALRDGQVQDAFLRKEDPPVSIAVFEWSSAEYQRLVVDWTRVLDAETLENIARRIENNPLPSQQSTTGIGAAIKYAGQLFQRGPECFEKTLDVSGDGQNNDWPRPEDARLDDSLNGVNINGLVIGAEFPIDHELNPNRMGALSNYYRARVIKGPGAFVEVANDFQDFGETMRRKLIRELSTALIGQLRILPATTDIQ